MRQKRVGKGGIGGRVHEPRRLAKEGAAERREKSIDKSTMKAWGHSLSRQVVSICNALCLRVFDAFIFRERKRERERKRGGTPSVPLQSSSSCTSDQDCAKMQRFLSVCLFVCVCVCVCV